MARMHLVEVEDLSWFPRVLRDAATSYLKFAFDKSGQAALFADKIAEALDRSGARHIVDLCSGCGGPLPTVLEELRKRGRDIGATLTDRYPNIAAFEDSSDPAVSYRTESVDATDVPVDLRGLRTLFNAFHHFEPVAARAILEKAVQSRNPVAVMELVTREPLYLVGLLIAPIAVVLTAPFWRPFRASHLLFCWALPMVPMVVLWDGLVSWLRIYSLEELRELVVGLDDYDWDIGLMRLDGLPVHGSYLIGTPKLAT